jgi:hypothetical protein
MDEVAGLFDTGQEASTKIGCQIALAILAGRKG